MGQCRRLGGTRVLGPLDFYENGRFTENLDRVRDYARLLASVGLNAISINNVNVHEIETKFITAEYLPTIAKVADIFREYGISLYLSINFAAPRISAAYRPPIR